MNILMIYVDKHWQPLSGLCVGIALIACYLYVYLTRQRLAVPLISKYIFRNQFMSEKSAESLFNVSTSYVLAIGGIWIVLALFYLING